MTGEWQDRLMICAEYDQGKDDWWSINRISGGLIDEWYWGMDDQMKMIGGLSGGWSRDECREEAILGQIGVSVKLMR